MSNSNNKRNVKPSSSGSDKGKGKGGAVNVGAKGTGPQTNRKKATPSSKAVADARKAASRSNNQVVLWVAGAVVVVALAVAGIFAINQRTGEVNKLPEGFPAGEVVDGVLVYGEDAAPAKVEYWVDLLCPFCRDFETKAADSIEAAVSAGDAQLSVHMVGNLDEASDPPGYSTRAASAVLCAAESDKSYRVMKVLYEEQPAEGGPGYTAEELGELAAEAGVDGDLTSCIKKEKYSDEIAKNTTDFAANGYTGTPTVLINGQKYEGAPEDLAEAIKAAA